jgi:AsmA protein
MRLRTIAIIAGIVIALPILGLGVFLLTFDANAYKPRIIETVRNATGRELTITGALRVKPALVPTVSVEGVSFANAPWGSRPQMATIRRAEASIALLPLLSGEVRFARIVLVEPDILLERRADGTANWQMGAASAAPAAPRAAGATSQAPAAAPARRAIAVEDFRIEKGRISLHDAVSGRQESVAVAELDGSVPAGDRPISLAGALAWRDVPLKLALSGGALAALIEPGQARPWPIDASIEAAGARIAVKGSLTDPARVAGYDLAVKGSIASLVRLAPLLPDMPLPPLNEVGFAAQLAGQGPAVPAVRALSLRIGGSDLAALRPGLVLRQLEASAPAADQPLAFTLEAMLGVVALRAEGGTGPLAALLPGARAERWPVRLAARVGEAQFSIDGALAEPGDFAGLDALVSLAVPDLAALSPLAGQDLPAIRDIALSARLVEHERRNGFALRDVRASAMGSDVSGEASLLLARQSRVEATLESRLVDLDALMAAMPAGAAPTPGSATAPADRPAPPARDARVIPDTKLPLELLRIVDARLALTVAELRFAGAPYRDAAMRAMLTAGVLDVGELRATLPEGTVRAGLAVDAAQATPTVAARLHAPGLALGALLRQFGVPFAMRGTMELDIDVKGRGDTVRAVAATMDGHAGVAIGQGAIDSRLLDSAVGELWRLMVPGAPRTGEIGVACLATRFDFAGGLGTARALLFDTSAARVTGTGTVNLADERLALRLLPTLRLGGGGLSVPIEVGGSFARPGYRARPEDVLGALGGLASGAGSGAGQGAAAGGPLGAVIGGIVGATRQGAGQLDAEACPAALAIARGSRAEAPAVQPAPAAPAPSSAPSATPAPAPAQPRSPIPGIRLPRLPF